MSEAQGVVTRHLVERRRALAISQRALAKAMGTTQSHVSDLENARNETSLRVMERWASALDLKLTLVLEDPWDDRNEGRA